MSKKQTKHKEQEDVVPENETVEQIADNTSETNSDNQTQATDETCESKIEILEKKVEELNDKYLRLIAEYGNYRKRTLKEKMELAKTAGEKLIVGILPVVDDFDRALQHLGKASDLDAVKAGIELIHNKFMNFLGQQGVKEIETNNQNFDADLHEAVTKIPAPSEDMKGKIVDCVQKGYLLEEKVIRYPKVVVGE